MLNIHCRCLLTLKILLRAKKMSTSLLPFFLEGEVVRGFGRGSKDIGCPTANYPYKVVETLPKGIDPGVYYGWAQVDSGPVYPMVANIGWCPFYQNKQKSVETHLMHKFDKDFYGSILKISLIGYLRPEKSFDSLDALIDQIKLDIQNAENLLKEPDQLNIKDHIFFAIESK